MRTHLNCVILSSALTVVLSCGGGSSGGGNDRSKLVESFAPNTIEIESNKVTTYVGNDKAVLIYDTSDASGSMVINDDPNSEWHYGYTILQASESDIGAVSSIFEGNDGANGFYHVIPRDDIQVSSVMRFDNVWYAVSESDGESYSNFGSEDGTIWLDPSSGDWSATLGNVSLDGQLSGVNITGQSQYQGVTGDIEGYQGSLNGSEISYGAFGGSDEDFAYAGVWDVQVD